MRKEQLGDDFTGNLFDTKIEDVDNKAVEEDTVEHQDHVMVEETIEEASVGKAEEPNDVVQEPSKKQRKCQKKVTFKETKKSQEDYLRNVTEGEGANKNLVSFIAGPDDDTDGLDDSGASTETEVWSPSFHSSPGYQKDDSHNGSENGVIVLMIRQMRLLRK